MEHTPTYLELVLKYQWFDMIQEGVKLEEYRDITPFWIKRIFSLFGCKLTENRAVYLAHHTEVLKSYLRYHLLEPRHSLVRFQRGYTYNPPRLIKNIEYIRIGTGKPEWGAQKGVEYIVIVLL